MNDESWQWSSQGTLLKITSLFLKIICDSTMAFFTQQVGGMNRLRQHPIETSIIHDGAEPEIRL